MTFKAAITGLSLGGGKAVIIGDSSKDKTEALMRKFGEYVNSLGGRYITAEDVGMNTSDMVLVKKETNFVTGLPLIWVAAEILLQLQLMEFIWVLKPHQNTCGVPITYTQKEC